MKIHDSDDQQLRPHASAGAETYDSSRDASTTQSESSNEKDQKGVTLLPERTYVSTVPFTPVPFFLRPSFFSGREPPSQIGIKNAIFG